MANEKEVNRWKPYAIISLAAMIAITTVSVYLRLWVLTAIPIGFLFGFFLKKGDLCGASAFSEVLIMRDRRKLFGLWILIVVAMIGFAVISSLGLVRLSPKPLLYLNYIIGGVFFGVGTVLAGGCISGCLYKGATGNLNSIAALLTIPAGVMAVEFGPLHNIYVALSSHVIKSKDGGAVSLSSISGIPYAALAAIFSIATLAAVILLRRPQAAKFGTKGLPKSTIEKLFTRPWKPWVSGIAIGLLMTPAYLSSVATGRNYPLGITHGVMQAELIFVDHGLNHVWKAPNLSVAAASATASKKPAGKPVSWWLVFVSLSLPIGAWTAGRMNGGVRFLPKPPDELMFALLGGFITGAGAALGTGCVVGNIMSGWALMSVGMIIFGLFAIAANWLTTYFYLMGGQRFKRG
jgi:uncharacterized protein